MEKERSKSRKRGQPSAVGGAGGGLGLSALEREYVSPSFKARVHKERGNRNSLKHGLSRLLTPPVSGVLPEISEVARRMCAGSTNPQLYQQALEVAHWGRVRWLVHQHEVALIRRRKDPGAMPRSPWKQLQIARSNIAREFQLADKISEDHPPEGAELGPEFVSLLSSYFLPAPYRSDLDAAVAALPELQKMSRYERRAFSKERSAMIEFLKIRERE